MNRTRFTLIAAIILIATVLVLIPKVPSQTSPGPADITRFRCEYLTNPMGIDAINPRLSGILTSSLRGERQTAYQNLAASAPKLLERNQGGFVGYGECL